ncbi:flagellar biosynthesis regulator FlaF [uncultured Enterovirga sp.]|uniref:flagellar biosynthesis regulator FlaF n=1 Tax=uncultured Enterovirga sp. TaxID=2026352 RepID=UPI0035CAA21A
MHSAAASAYAKTARTTQSPRDLEASILLKAAQQLQSACDNWQPDGTELGTALTYNRKIWTILATSATEPDNPLPAQIKANIAQLAAVIFQRTLAILMEPAPEKLALLVRINREVASGLRTQPAIAQPAMAQPAAA